MPREAVPGRHRGRRTRVSAVRSLGGSRRRLLFERVNHRLHRLQDRPGADERFTRLEVPGEEAGTRPRVVCLRPDAQHDDEVVCRGRVDVHGADCGLPPSHERHGCRH